MLFQDSSGVAIPKNSRTTDDSNMRPNHRVTLQELKALGGLKPFHELQIVARKNPTQPMFPLAARDSFDIKFKDPKKCTKKDKKGLGC